MTMMIIMDDLFRIETGIEIKKADEYTNTVLRNTEFHGDKFPIDSTKGWNKQHIKDYVLNIKELHPEFRLKIPKLPYHKNEHECVMYFSRPYSLLGRNTIIGFIPDKEGKFIWRAFYQSGTHGVWRYLSGYYVRNTGDETKLLLHKGYGAGESSVNLPFFIQKALFNILDQTMSANRFMRIEKGDKDYETYFLATYESTGQITPLTANAFDEIEFDKISPEDRQIYHIDYIDDFFKKVCLKPIKPVGLDNGDDINFLKPIDQFSGFSNLYH